MDRVKGQKINIDHNKVKSFWDKRAETYTEENPYSSVKLRENKNNELEIWDQYEKELIVNNLHIDKNSKVIDMGCGVGRMSEYMMSVAGYYLGVDCSEQLINLAENRIKTNNNYDFVISDVSEVDSNKLESLQLTHKFDKILIIGCMQYLNDGSIVKLMRNILTIADDNCSIYITNSEAREQRLTLNEFNSEVLGAYSSIYRTHDENLELYEPLFESGFKMITHAPLSINEHYLETVHTYTIMSRN